MSNVSLKFTSLISSKILDELQKNIQNYAQVLLISYLIILFKELIQAF